MSRSLPRNSARNFLISTICCGCTPRPFACCHRTWSMAHSTRATWVGNSARNLVWISFRASIGVVFREIRLVRISGRLSKIPPLAVPGGTGSGGGATTLVHEPIQNFRRHVLVTKDQVRDHGCVARRWDSRRGGVFVCLYRSPPRVRRTCHGPRTMSETARPPGTCYSRQPGV